MKNDVHFWNHHAVFCIAPRLCRPELSESENFNIIGAKAENTDTPISDLMTSWYTKT